MIQILIEVDNRISGGSNINIKLAIHLDFVNSIKLSPPICHLVEKFGITITILNPLLLYSLAPKDINGFSHHREFFFNSQSLKSIRPRERLLLLLI